MVDNESTVHSDRKRGGQGFSITMLVITLVATVIFAALAVSVGGLVIALAFLFCPVVLVSFIIWQACEPFADAAQWIGKTLRIPGSVRGATLDAIASSLPELTCGLFFVLIATGVVGDGTTVSRAIVEQIRNEQFSEGRGKMKSSPPKGPPTISLECSPYRSIQSRLGV